MPSLVKSFFVSGDYGWRLFRIPLADMTAVGSPSRQNVETVRLWLDGFEEEAYSAIASIELTDEKPQETSAY